MKRLVIIGGGFAGTKIASDLQDSFQTTLIDQKDYFEFTPGILRAIVKPKILEKIESTHKNYLRKTRHIKSSVKKIGAHAVILENGKKEKFDYLVIASGSEYTTPIKVSNMIVASRGKSLASHHEQLKKAKKIAIVGGGPVGIELAGEIVEEWPEKNIFLIHSGWDILERNQDKTKYIARKFLEKKGVRFVFGERVIGKKGKNVHTDKGNKFEADIVIFCTGIKPHSGFIDKKELDDHGFVKVNEFLQMEGKKNIFVCGDIASIKEEKTAQNAESQAGLVIKNLERIEDKKPLIKYKTEKRAVVLSLGKWNGIFENNYFTISGKLPALMKWMIQKSIMMWH